MNDSGTWNRAKKYVIIVISTKYDTRGCHTLFIIKNNRNATFTLQDSGTVTQNIDNIYNIATYCHEVVNRLNIFFGQAT